MTTPEPAPDVDILDTRGASLPGHPLHPTWRSWASMVGRCRATDGGYASVGLADPRWLRFGAFLADMGPRPPGCTLDRIDSASDYGPGLCRWASPAVQASNRRTTRLHSLDGIGGEAPLLAWCEAFDVDPHTVRLRLHRGWSLADALERPTARSFDVGWEAWRKRHREGEQRRRAAG
jgi:hypothetical protein